MKVISRKVVLTLSPDECAVLDALRETIREEDERHGRGEVTVVEFMTVRSKLLAIKIGADCADQAKMIKRATRRKK